MDLFDLVAKITLDSSEYERNLDDASSKTSSFGDKLKSGFSTAGKIFATGLAAGGAAVVSLGKQAVEAYADYEQLAGGVETLFKDSAGTVQEYAANAYKTAGLSANEYMETVTSFSASLLQSLGGDTEQAAKIGDMAITDMADNANKMGTSIESIQAAYQGFAKQNYTMLDNLKLGYGGTKEEMERLLADATALSGVDYDIENLSDVYNAIHVIQTELGVTGTTAKEASTTISGSVASMKSAWQNLIVGVADENANFDELVNNFVESATTAAGNILPRVEQALTGIGQLVESLAPVIVDALPTLVGDVLPSILDSAFALVMGLVTGIVDNLPELLDAALEMVFALADGIIDAIPQLIPAIVTVILTIVEKLTEPSTIMQLIQAAFQIMGAIFQGLVAAIPRVVAAVPTIIGNILSAFSSYYHKLLSVGGELISKVAQGIGNAATDVWNSITDLLAGVWNRMGEGIEAAKTWGSDLISNFINGVVAQAQALWDTIKGIGQGIRNLIGFSEPKEGPLSNFHTYAPDMMKLFAKGIKDNEGLVTDQLEKSFDFESDITANARVNGTAKANGGNSDGIINIVVQSVLDGKVIGETAYKYQRGMARAGATV